MNLANYTNQSYARVEDLEVPAYYAKSEIEGQRTLLLEEAIKRSGIKSPLVVNHFSGHKGLIVDGVQRFQIAKKIGIQEVPVFLLNVPEDLEKSLHYQLSLNSREYSIEDVIDHLKKDYWNYFDVLVGDNNNSSGHDSIFENADRGMSKGSANIKRIHTFPLHLNDLEKPYLRKLQALLSAKSQNEAILQVIKERVDGGLAQ